MKCLQYISKRQKRKINIGQAQDMCYGMYVFLVCIYPNRSVTTCMPLHIYTSWVERLVCVHTNW